MTNPSDPSAKLIVPTSFEVTRDKKAGEQIKLSFFEDDEEIHAVMPRDQIALFVSHVLKESQVTLDGTIDPGQLDVGGVMAPLGREVRKLETGAVLLTVHVQTDEGVRALPLHLTAEDAVQISRELSGN